MPIPGGVPFLDEGTTTDLVDLDDAKAHLDIEGTTDYDDELSDFISRASDDILSDPQYFVDDIVPIRDRTQDWYGEGSVIFLEHYPVTADPVITEYVSGVGTALASEPIDTATFTSYGYRLNADNGMITRLSSGYPTNYLGPVRIEYTTGTGVVPPGLRGAVLDLIGHMWETQRGGNSTTRPEIGQDFDTLDPAPSPHRWPLRVLQAMASYDRRLRPSVG